MSSKHFVSFVTAAALLTSIAPATAGGKAIECYQPYRTAPIYDTVTENVQIQPSYTDVQRTPPIIGTRQRTILVAPERVQQQIIPAVYGYEKERVLIQPERVIARRTAPVYETRYRTVKVADGGYSWEWRVINGKRVLCKVKNKAVYKKIAEQVQISSGSVVNETVPAVWGYQKRQVLIAPARTQSIVVPAQYKTVTEQVVVKPEQVRKTYVGPSYQTRQRAVLVEPGRTGWKRVAIRNHCKS